MARTRPVTAVGLAERAFRVLLIAYPPGFREAFGSEMAQVFRDVCREVHRERGLAGLSALCLRTVIDLAATAAEERLEEGLMMSRSFRVRLGGAAAMAGGLLWALWSALLGLRPPGIAGAFRPTDDLDPLIASATVLLALGLVGLHARFGAGRPLLGGGLLLGLLGGLGGLAVLLGRLLVPAYPSEDLWLLPFLGMFGVILGSLLAGLGTFQLGQLPGRALRRIQIGAVIVAVLAAGAVVTGVAVAPVAAVVLLLALGAVAYASLKQSEGAGQVHGPAVLMILGALVTLAINTEDWRIWLAVPFGAAWAWTGLEVLRDREEHLPAGPAATA